MYSQNTDPNDDQRPPRFQLHGNYPHNLFSEPAAWESPPILQDLGMHTQAAQAWECPLRHQGEARKITEAARHSAPGTCHCENSRGSLWEALLPVFPGSGASLLFSDSITLMLSLANTQGICQEIFRHDKADTSVPLWKSQTRPRK